MLLTFMLVRVITHNFFLFIVGVKIYVAQLKKDIKMT